MARRERNPAARVQALERAAPDGPINPLALEEFNELQERLEVPWRSKLEGVRNAPRPFRDALIKAVDMEIR